MVHKAIPGGYDVTLREGKRTAVFGERPFFDAEGSETLSQKQDRLSLQKKVNGTHRKDGDVLAHRASEAPLNN